MQRDLRRGSPWLAVLAVAVAGLAWVLAHVVVTQGDATGPLTLGREDAVSVRDPDTLVEGSGSSGETSVASKPLHPAATHLAGRMEAGEVSHVRQAEDVVTVPFHVRVAGIASEDAGWLELDYARTTESYSNEIWHGAVPLERDGPLHVARLPCDLGRRVLVVEVRSRNRDLTSGIVRLGRLLDEDAILDVNLHEVGELLVIVQPPSGASGATNRSPFDGGQAPALEVRRIDVSASVSGEVVTAYGERVCAVVRAPRLYPSRQHGGSLFQRVPAGSVRVEVDELRARIATHDCVVRRGERSTLTVPLESLELAGSLSGAVVIDGPMLGNGIYIVARSLTNPTRTFQAFALGSGDSRASAPYPWRIEDMPAGEYHVVPMPASFLPIDPPTRTVAAPAEGLDFVVRHTGETRWYDWQVIDAASRAPLEDVWIDFDRRDGTLRSLRLDRSPAERFPCGADVRWTVRCAGYEKRSGTLADCDRPEPRASRTDERELRIHRDMQEVWVCDLELSPANR